MRRSAIVLAIALAVTGCSSGGEEGAVKDAATKYAEFIEAGDTSIKSVMTERCQDVASGIALSAMKAEVGTGGFTITVKSVEGDTAEVDVDFKNIEGKKGDPATFSKIDGEWLFDGCP